MDGKKLSMNRWCWMRATTLRLCGNEMKAQPDVMEFRVFIVSMINSSRSAVVTVIDAMFILSFDVCILNIRI